ncbi:hypothetical protein PAXRUDRAFT_70221, partial [Paxillus rubicundulus Ve08.2h10]
MAGRPKSNDQKRCERVRDHEEAMAYAIQLYREDEGKPKDQRRGLRVVCRQVEEKMMKEKKYVTLNHVTLKRRLEGGKSCQQANEESQGWLTREEEETVVKYCLELAERGFPLTHHMLKCHVDTLLLAQLGSTFSQDGVGKKWTDRFLNRHSNRLHKYWSSSLDTNRGRASAIDKYHIEQNCIWAADETGFQPGEG